MKRIFLIIFVLAGYAVFAQQTLPCTNIGVNNLGGQSPYITGSCLEVNSDLHVNNKIVIMEADNRIHFGPGTHISLVQQGDLHASIRPNALQVAWMEPGTVGSVAKYEKLELGVKIPDVIQSQVFQFLNSNASAVDPNHPGLNPFNPEEISVEAIFNTSVSHPLIPVPIAIERKVFGFWYREFDRPQLSNEYTELATDYHFRIRFAPPNTGNWTCVIRMYINGTLSYETSPFHFNVVSSGNPGYVKVGDSKRFLVRGNNMFFPIGTNLPMISCHGQTCSLCDSSYYDPSNHVIEIDSNQFWEESYRFYWIPPIEYDFYRHDMAAVASSGANMVRYMMSPWGNDFEFERLNNYDNVFYHDPNTGEMKQSLYRSQFSWEMDRYFDEAEQENLFIYLNVIWQDVFLTDTSGALYDWEPNNVENYPDDMGYCYHTELNLQDRTDFLTNPDAIRYFKYKLRYIAARWGYSTAMFALQLNSEINGAFGVDYDSISPIHSQIESWHNIMLSYLKDSLQISQLTSVSYAGVPGRSNGEKPYTTAYDRSFYLPDLDLPAHSMYQILPGRQFESYSIRRSWLPANSEEFYSAYGSGWNYNYYAMTQMKPMINSEIGSYGPYRWSLTCDNKAEWIKNTYITPFTGMAGMGVHWAPNFNYDLWQTWFPKIAAFLAPYNFNEDGGWVPFHDYDEMHYEDWHRKPGIVDLFYLRSPDEKSAVGVLANRTYNFYTAWDVTTCGQFDWNEIEDTTDENGDSIPDLQEKFENTWENDGTLNDYAYNYPIIAYYYNESLQVDVKSKKTYIVTYFNALTLQVVGSEEKYNATGKLNLNFPFITGVSSRPIILFTVEPKNKDKSAEQYLDSIRKQINAVADDFQINAKNDFAVREARIYPNPAGEYINIELPENVTNCRIELLSSTGMLVKSDEFSGISYKLSLDGIDRGLFILRLLYGQKIETFKIVLQ